jgi:hypothetical protein
MRAGAHAPWYAHQLTPTRAIKANTANEFWLINMLPLLDITHQIIPDYLMHIRQYMN